MTPPKAPARKPATWRGALANIAIALVFLGLGPAMIGIGAGLDHADAELARTGERAPGTIIDFDDARRASQRDISVEFQSADGTVHYTSASVDHEQHPVVNDEVTVAYRESDPGQATVLGFESDGTFLAGAGGIVTLISWAIAVPLLVKSMLGRRRRRKQGAG